MPGWINVPMKIETRNRLEKIRKDEESFDKIVNKLCDIYENLPTDNKDTDENSYKTT